MPRNRTADVIGGQLLRASTLVGPHYRAACCTKATVEFISKRRTVEQGADEIIYWMDLPYEDKIADASLLESLMKGADEILAMIFSSIKTTRKKK